MKTTLLTKYLVTVVLGFGFISALLYARVQIANNKKPTPSLIPLPVVSPASTPVVKGIATTKPQVINNDPITDCVSSAPNCSGDSIRLKQSQCKYITCCGFSDGRWEVYPSTEKCKADQNAFVTANQPTYNFPTPNIGGDGKIDCSYVSAQYSFNFGRLTYDECMVKSDQYWAEQRALIKTTPPTPSQASTPIPTKSPEEIQKCKDAVRAETTNLINGCYIKYGDSSASDACARGVQAQQAAKMIACES